MKSREEVEDLKQQWINDGCWDIEKTEGFEDYREELEEFSKEHSLRSDCSELVINSYKLVSEIKSIMSKVEGLHESISNLKKLSASKDRQELLLNMKMTHYDFSKKIIGFWGNLEGIKQNSFQLHQRLDGIIEMAEKR